MEQKNRWLVVIGAVLIQLALGAIYAWSVFTNALKEAPFNFSTSQTQAVFSAGLVTFAVVMIFAGIAMKKYSPRKMAITSAIVLGGGYILGGLFGSDFWSQLLFIGIIGGAGIGIGYVVPIAVGMKWFPDKKGLISGLAVAGFGFGAVGWVKIAGSWFGLIDKLGVQKVFFYYGLAFAAMVLIGSIWMVNPPANYKVKGIKEVKTKKAAKEKDVQWKDMIKTWDFWSLWLMYMIGSIAGLMVIGTIKLFGIDTLQGAGMTVALAGAAAGTAMAWYAVFNGLGRITWGKISDTIGPKLSLLLNFAIQGVLMLTLFNMGKSGLMLAVYTSAIGFNYGGLFALFPVSTAKFFGTKNVGSNYPFVFTSYGVAGIVGPLLGGFVRDATGSFLMAFIPAGIACLVGAGIAMTIKKC